MQIGLLAAFLGGALALLSPCSALLLPTFFASTLDSPGRLLGHCGVFYLGLLCTLVPVGLGVSAAGRILVTHRDIMIAVAGSVIIMFGVITALGKGFDLRRWLPIERVQLAARGNAGLARPLLLGMSSGVAGFCAGPILGAILTTTALAPPLPAAVTMASYAAGMLVPLVTLALLAQRRPERVRRRVRGVTIAGLSIHPVSLGTGIMLIAVGVLFIVTNGLIEVGEFFSIDQLAAMQSWVLDADSVGLDIALIVLSSGLVLAWWFVRHRRRERQREARQR